MGDKANILMKEFNLEGYELLNNSTHNNMKGVSIALEITKDIKVMDASTDKEERIIALTLTVVALYDANTNTDCHLVEIERILEDIEANNGIIVGRDFNTLTNEQWGQKEYTLSGTIRSYVT